MKSSAALWFVCDRREMNERTLSNGSSTEPTSGIRAPSCHTASRRADGRLQQEPPFTSTALNALSWSLAVVPRLMNRRPLSSSRARNLPGCSPPTSHAGRGTKVLEARTRGPLAVRYEFLGFRPVAVPNGAADAGLEGLDDDHASAAARVGRSGAVGLGHRIGHGGQRNAM